MDVVLYVPIGIIHILEVTEKSRMRKHSLAGSDTDDIADDDF